MRIDRNTKYKVQPHMNRILSLYSNLKCHLSGLPLTVGWQHPRDPASVLVVCCYCQCLHKHGRPAPGGSPFRRADCGGGGYRIMVMPGQIDEYILVAAELKRREGSKEARYDRAAREWRDMLAEMKRYCSESRAARGCRSTSRLSGSQPRKLRNTNICNENS